MSDVIGKVVAYYPRALHGDGGVTNSLWLWAQSLTGAGVDVEVAYDARLPVVARPIPPGVSTRGVRHRGRGRLAAPDGLAASLSENSVLVLHSGYVRFNLAAAAVARDRGVPYVVMPLGAYDPHIRATRRAAKAVWEVAERRMLERALAVHVFFPREEEHVLALAPGARTVTAPTAFDLPEDQWLGEGSDGPEIVWVGRYDIRHKGLDRLIHALAMLQPGDRPLLRLHGRDSKNTRRDVQRMVDELDLTGDVEVRGPIEGSDKRTLLLNATAYVHPSRWESYGVALVEAMSLGVPVITTSDVNLADDLIRSDAAEVTAGSAEGLSRGLRAAADGRLVAVGPRGRNFVREHLNHVVAGSTFLSQIERMLTSAARA